MYISSICFRENTHVRPFLRPQLSSPIVIQIRILILFSQDFDLQTELKPDDNSQNAWAIGSSSTKRKLPDWMSSASKQPVLKKKMKSNSLFRWYRWFCEVKILTIIWFRNFSLLRLNCCKKWICWDTYWFQK